MDFSLKNNGDFNVAIASLAEKARKAIFKIKKTLGLNNPCKLLENMFDSLVVPILTNCSEIWGITLNFKDTVLLEKLHVKFLKEILGVHCKTSNDACRAEHGRLPLKTRTIFSSIKFLDHIKTQTDTLVYKTYQTTKPTNPWIKSVNTILHNLGFSCLINNSITLKPYRHSIKQRIIDQCLQEQNAKICSSSKLSFFQKFYILNDRANYVDNLINKCDRSTISRIIKDH